MKIKIPRKKNKEKINNNIEKDNIIKNDNYKIEKNILKNKLGHHYDVLREYHCIIAGGAITSIFTKKEINDFDIYFKSKNDLFLFLTKEMKKRWIISYTSKSFTFKLDNDILIQCIYFDYFKSAEELFESFDFTVCMGSFDFEKESFILHKDFLYDNSKKSLVFNKKTRYPFISFLRIEKYKDKGYAIDKNEYVKMLLRISDIKINSYKELKEQIGGMYGEYIDMSFDEKEEFSIDSVIDKIEQLKCEPKSIYKNGIDEILDWDEFVFDVLKIKKQIFEFDGVKYIIVNNNIREFYENNKDENMEEIDIYEYFKFPIIRYKYVNYVNGELFSFYDNRFKYKVGEYVSGEQLYCVKKEYTNGCSYCDIPSRKMIEVIIEKPEYIKDITALNNNILVVNKMYINRVIEKDEEDKIRNIYNKGGVALF